MGFILIGVGCAISVKNKKAVMPSRIGFFQRSTELNIFGINKKGRK